MSARGDIGSYFASLGPFEHMTADAPIVLLITRKQLHGSIFKPTVAVVLWIKFEGLGI